MDRRNLQLQQGFACFQLPLVFGLLLPLLLLLLLCYYNYYCSVTTTTTTNYWIALTCRLRLCKRQSVAVGNVGPGNFWDHTLDVSNTTN